MVRPAPSRPPGRAFEACGDVGPREMVVPASAGQNPAYRAALTPPPPPRILASSAGGSHGGKPCHASPRAPSTRCRTAPGRAVGPEKPFWAGLRPNVFPGAPVRPRELLRSARPTRRTRERVPRSKDGAAPTGTHPRRKTREKRRQLLAQPHGAAESPPADEASIHASGGVEHGRCANCISAYHM